MKLSQKHINIIQAFFVDKPVERAYLFVSRARNEATDSSDIDLLVHLNYASGISLLGFIGLRQDLENQLQMTVDLVSSQGISPFIKPIIDAEKQLIYEKAIEGNGVKIIRGDCSINTSGLNDIFTNANIDAKQLRNKAWQRY